jgi:single-stranded DNA-binding protein
MAKNEIVTLFGNLGGDPDVRHPRNDGVRHEYDPVSDQVVAKPISREERVFRTFSIAVSTPEMEEPRWIRCVDWTNQSQLFKKGDRVRLTGFFQIRTYPKDGELKRVKQFVVKTAAIERARMPQEAAA